MKLGKFNQCVNFKQALIAIAMLSLCVCSYAVTNAPATVQSSQQTPTPSKRQLPVKQVKQFVSAFGQIKNYYVKPISDEKLFELAIRGMLSGLDPHSDYLDSEDFNNLKTTTTGKFGGLGIEIEMGKGYIKVISPIDDTPAARAGVQPGDRIVRIDGVPIKGLTIQQAIKRMRGPKGSKVTVTILRKGTPKPIKLTLTREVINIKSVRAKLLDKYYGYIRISHFQTPTAKTMVVLIKKMQQKTDGKMKGLILDLRNNPGGLLDSAIAVADAFLNTKNKLNYGDLIVYTKGRIPEAQVRAAATPGDILKGLPIVVLINGGSASGSEIVAGALQDHHRAVIIGQKTFGKGSVQTVLPLTQDRAIKLTTALYYTPSGRSIQATGIEPDIIVDNIKIPEKKDGTLDIITVREAHLRGHLANGNGKLEDNTKVNAKASHKDKSKTAKPLIRQDFQLYEALNILKAMNIAHRKSQPSG